MSRNRTARGLARGRCANMALVVALAIATSAAGMIYPGHEAKLKAAPGDPRSASSQSAASASSFFVSDAEVVERSGGQTTMFFTVTLVPPLLTGEASIAFATRDNTATAPSDYRSASGRLVFFAAEVSKLVPIDVVADTAPEQDETFFLDLSDPAGAGIADAQGTGTIVNDDQALDAEGSPSLSISDARVKEGNPGDDPRASFEIKLSRPSDSVVKVNYGTGTAGTADSQIDYRKTEGTLVFAAGENHKTVEVAIISDDQDEDDETFELNLSEPVNGRLADPTGQGLILDDDDPPEIRINDISVTEGNTGTKEAAFTVSLSRPTVREVTVGFETEDKTAAAQEDYEAADRRTLTFPAGVLNRTISVSVIGDLVDEPDESFLVRLSSPMNATLSDDQGEATIGDEDPRPVVSIDDARSKEGENGLKDMVFTAYLNGITSASISIDYKTADQSARSPSDYVPSTGRLIIPPRATSGTIAVPVKGDRDPEPDEAFWLKLSIVGGEATLSDANSNGYILDDDGYRPPTVAATFDRPLAGGIDHHDSQKEIVVSLRRGQPSVGTTREERPSHNFETVDKEGRREPYSDVAGIDPDILGNHPAIEVATVREGPCQGGFATGDMFFTTGLPGHIGRVYPDGKVRNPWVVLPRDGAVIALVQDHYCAAGGDLLAATGGSIWRISGLGVSSPTPIVAMLRKPITAIAAVPDQPKYGPWGGKILFAGGSHTDCVYSIGPNGGVPECFFQSPGNFGDIDVIPPGQNFFGVDRQSNSIVGIASQEFANLDGGIMFTQEGPRLLEVRWNGVGFAVNEFLSIAGGWGDITFSCLGIAPVFPISQATACQLADGNHEDVEEDDGPGRNGEDTSPPKSVLAPRELPLHLTQPPSLADPSSVAQVAQAPAPNQQLSQASSAQPQANLQQQAGQQSNAQQQSSQEAHQTSQHQVQQTAVSQSVAMTEKQQEKEHQVATVQQSGSQGAAQPQDYLASAHSQSNAAPLAIPAVAALVTILGMLRWPRTARTRAMPVPGRQPWRQKASRSNSHRARRRL